MDVQNVHFHNVVELEQVEDPAGIRLHRFPEEVRRALSEKGQSKAVQSSGCELRFITDADQVRVTMSSLESNGRVLVFRGDFFHSSHGIPSGVVTTLELNIPERFADVEQDRLDNHAFSSKVWRIYCERFSAVFHDIDAFGHEVRVPMDNETPQLSVLAYGSSITQGAGALSHYNGYIQQAARRLQVDALNLGLSGSCYCEKELADHIAERSDWDMAFLELGVNMRGVVPVLEFEQRVTYLLDQILTKHPGKPVFLTTIYPNRAGFFKNPDHAYTQQERLFNEVLRGYAEGNHYSNLHLLEGRDILTDFTSLTSDLIHPSDYGHIRMGEMLAEKMRPVVDRLLMKRTQEPFQIETKGG